MYKIIFARKIFPYLPEKSFNKWRFLYICKNSSPMSDYKPRIADALLKRKLAGNGAILIRFPYLPWRLAQCRWNGPWYCSRPCIWLLRRDGRYGLIEIKLGGEALIKEGVKSLTALKNKLDTTKMNKPSFLMVLTGVGSIAYRRPEDGIYVVPTGCLKP